MKDNHTEAADEAEEASPIPGSLVNSLRAFGYELDTAIADLVDNSISAGAKRIDIRFDWNDGSPRISITDDGSGMTPEKLVEALRLGTVNPKHTRHKSDLGRFGLGLKTASFSQARRLVVATKSSGSALVARCWDLDHIETSNKWRLLVGDSYLTQDETDRIRMMQEGTMVLLDKLDRIFSRAATDEHNKSEFFSLAEKVSDHLGAVFHRFLTGPKKLSICINPDVPGASPVEPWDPYLANHEKTQVLPDEYLSLRGELVYVQPYVLPHQSAFNTVDEHRRAGGLKGWNAQQGFYVYRNNRMLVSGSWLNLGIRQEEHYKLARISIDISNDLDDIWAIDVRKSQAFPPSTIRSELRRIATRTRKQAKDVYSHRGKIITGAPARKVVPLWQAKKKGERISYRVNRSYPLLQELKGQLDSAGKDLLSKVLTLIEETIPVSKISFNAIEEPESHLEPFEGRRDIELVQTAKVLLQHYRNIHQYNFDEALDLLMAVEPFDRHPYLREALRERSLNEH